MKRLAGLILIMAPFALVLISIVTLITTAPINNKDIPLVDNFAIKQALFAMLGGILAVLIAKTDIDYFRVPGFIFFFWGVSFLSLILVLLLPRSIANTHRWFVVGPFTIQPSELVKPLYYLTLAYILSSSMPTRFKIGALAFSSLPIWLLIFLEPDAGTTIFYISVTAIVVLVWSSKWKFVREGILLSLAISILFILAVYLGSWYIFFLFVPLFWAIRDFKSWLAFGAFLSLVGLGIAFGFVLWKFNILKQYQKQRLEPFIQAYQQDGIKGIFQIQKSPNSHVRQARIAIGSAGIFGKGPWQGTQSRLRFLPEYTTDFIYAAFVEEFGLIGGFVVVLIYIFWLLAIFTEILFQKEEFYFLLALFIFVGMSFQIIVNIGMNLGLLPTKGMPLPFFSYGGSSLIGAFVQLGFLYSIYRKW